MEELKRKYFPHVCKNEIRHQESVELDSYTDILNYINEAVKKNHDLNLEKFIAMTKFTIRITTVPLGRENKRVKQYYTLTLLISHYTIGKRKKE